jgi:hypothetical protein
MSLFIASTTRDQINQALISSIGNNAYYVIYSGQIPATISTNVYSNSIITTLPVSGVFATTSNGVITLTNPSSNGAVIDGTTNFFRVYTNSNSVILQGTIGQATRGIWQANTSYSTGMYISNARNAYKCQSTGTSNTSGFGPVGNISPILDGTTSWNYIGTSSADFIIDNVNVIQGDIIQMTTGTNKFVGPGGNTVNVNQVVPGFNLSNPILSGFNFIFGN